ncbi:MAG: hypothetical protein CR988_04820 [Treponema sp.]|nr:MAG: hypothetical protein CR988_04820 [Treponema sp.]
MKIRCLCEHKFEVQPIVKLDLDKTPEYLDKIKNGTFNSFKCPKCGYELRAESKTEIIWKSKSATLVFIPENKRIYGLSISAGEDEKNETENKKFKFDKNTPLVIGYSELADRINVLDANLDPKGIEVVKFIALQNAGPVDKKNLSIFFKQLKNDKLEFFVSGLKKDEVAVIKIPKKIYDEILNDNKNNELFSAVSIGNYISYKNIYMEGSSG